MAKKKTPTKQIIATKKPKRPPAPRKPRRPKKIQAILDADPTSPLPDDPNDEIDARARDMVAAFDEGEVKKRTYARKLTTSKIKAALLETGGIVTQAAEILGCSRAAVYDFIKRTPGIKEWIEEIREEILDAAESTIVLAIMGGNLEVARWYLSKMGTGRGYVERHQFQQVDADGKPYDLKKAIAADKPVLRPDGPVPLEVVL
jgi:predicted transcriptional regulator